MFNLVAPTELAGILGLTKKKAGKDNTNRLTAQILNVVLKPNLCKRLSNSKGITTPPVLEPDHMMPKARPLRCTNHSSSQAIQGQ
jgi:hypothetical protein